MTFAKWIFIYVLSFLYVCMVNTIYLLSFVETPRKFFAIINLRGVSTKLNKYIYALLSRSVIYRTIDVNDF